MFGATTTAQMLTQWLLVFSVVFIFTLMLLGSMPTQMPETMPKIEPSLHILDYGHESVSLEEPKMPGVNLPGGDGTVWKWGQNNTTPEQRKALGDRVAVEAEWVLDAEGVWHTENLLKQPLSIADDPRGTWTYGQWPTNVAKKTPVDDATATVSAKTVWGVMGENTTLEYSDELGHRVVLGEYLLDGMPTGLRLRAVLDGGTVVYADGFVHTPEQEQRYLRPSVQEVLSVWNRTARGGGVQAVSWRDGYSPAAGVNGTLYLMPAYIFRDRDGLQHPVCAIDPSVIRLHPAATSRSEDTVPA
jgi:hypothetical protein